ncbi:MAG: hypothetical protein M1820_004760 [Bogoriella megaspora]|nr:MAG: hypothetical protein M1820_004760 [Bogoriella megaspora]
MPLMGLRSNRSEKDLHRRSTFDPSNFFRRSEQVSRSQTPADYPPPNYGEPNYEEVHTAPASSHGQFPQPPPSPPIQPSTPQTRRFSRLKSRHASDSQLSTRAKEQAAATDVPPVPSVPAGGKNASPQDCVRQPLTVDQLAPSIITTAPTMESAKYPPRKSKPRTPFKRRKNPLDQLLQERLRPQRSNTFSEHSNGGFPDEAGTGNGIQNEEDPTRLSTSSAAFGHNASGIAPSDPRYSESSRSEGISGGYGNITPAKNSHSTSTMAFFRLPGRNKRASLFPLPVKIPPPDAPAEQPHKGFLTPRASTSALTSGSSNDSPTVRTPPATAVPHPHAFKGQSLDYPTARHATSQGALAASSVSFAAPGANLFRNDSTTSAKSSPPGLLPPMRLEKRTRSPTKGSSIDVPSTPPLPISGRDSMTMAGRSSLGTVFSMSRFRQSSEPQSSRHGSPASGQTPGGTTKSNSFALSREALVLPEREEGETPVKYLAKVEDAVPRSCIASLLSKTADQFSSAVLRSYMRTFAFFGEPIDMAVRKLLMEAELPKETQQIDRVIQGFADRYHECNPGIFTSSEQAYILAFSIIILQTDVFNRNNKNKMQKTDYVKMASGNDVSDDVLGCFYDNISYTPFIHIDDDINISGSRPGTHKPRKALFKNPAPEQMKKVATKEPLDPYTLIMESKLDILRPELRSVINLEDPYTYLGTAPRIDLKALSNSFFKFGVLQIISARSRPEAFMSPQTTDNPHEGQAGVVDIMVTKVGILWRKDTKKKKTRSPWQEWGAILTGSQLYLFRSSAWVKGLMHQYDVHQKQGHGDTPVVFKPPLTDFKPDTFLSTENAVALLDATYRRHKHAFTFIRHGGLEETFLADNESEMNDWLAKLNYASTFRSANIRMKGLVGGSYEGQQRRGIRRLDSSRSTRSVQTPTGEVTIQSGRINAKLAQEILESRKRSIMEKIAHAEMQLNDNQKELDRLLRNARHLQILAPIQPKTRQDLIMAAGRMEAQLRWARKDIWRVRCHKDILAKDIEEDLKPGETPAGQQPVDAGGSLEPTTSVRTAKVTSSPRTSPILSPKRSQRSLGSPREEVKTLMEAQTEQAFKAPPKPLSPTRSSDPWQLPPLSLDPQRQSRGSIVSLQASNAAQDTQSVASSHDLEVRSPTVSNVTKSPHATPTPSIDEKEQTLLREAGLLSEERNRPRTAGDSDQERATPGSPDGRSKVRRSLHRTLRESHGHSIRHGSSHHRSHKGKDSASSAGLGDEDTPRDGEGLARTTGSFTVHGKKASVIHFGSEWKSMSPDDRLKARRSAHSQNARLSIPNAIEDGDGLDTREASRAGADEPSLPRESPSVIPAASSEAAESESTTTALSAHSNDDGLLVPPIAGDGLSSVSQESIFEPPQPISFDPPGPRTFEAEDLLPPTDASPVVGEFHTPRSRRSEVLDEATVSGEEGDQRKTRPAKVRGEEDRAQHQELDLGGLQPQLRAISAES